MTTLVVLLGLGGGVTTEVLAPQIAQAGTERVELSLECQPDETYQTMLSRAETAALSAIQQSFNQDSLMTNVSVMLIGQNHGAIAPVLLMDVSRDQWLSNPDVQHWVRYFTTARSLLGFQDVATTTPAKATQGTSNPSVAKTTNPSNTNQTPTSAIAPPLPSTTVVPVKTPDTSQNPSPQNILSRPGVSTLTSTEDTFGTPTTPVNNGTIISNPTTISIPNSGGIILNNPGTTPIMPNNIPSTVPESNMSGLNNTIPVTITPNQNVSPNGTSPVGL